VASFHVLDGEYAIDGVNAYYQWEEIPKVDIKTFYSTSVHYAVDKNHVWYRSNIISQPFVFPKKTSRAVDRASFKDLGRGIAEDKIGKICMGIPVEYLEDWQKTPYCRK
jgi:hypothetical protein